MERKLLTNIVVNTLLAAFFIVVCNNAVVKGYEETVITYLITYSILVTVVNALLVKYVK